MATNKTMEMSLEEATEYFSKYINADKRLDAWKELTGKTEKKKPEPKKEEKVENDEE